MACTTDRLCMSVRRESGTTPWETPALPALPKRCGPYDALILQAAGLASRHLGDIARPDPFRARP